MDRVYGSLEFQEPFEQTTRLMHQSLVTVERNCHSLRDHVKEQRRLIADSLRTFDNHGKKTEAYRAALDFYDHIRTDLVKLEEICQEYRLKIQADMVSEMNKRLQPSFRTCFTSVKRSFDLYNNKLLNNGNNNRRSMTNDACNWTNVSSLALDHTQDIIYGPKRHVPSEFDDSDEKFKQEMMILRTKIFSTSNKRISDTRDRESITDERRLTIGRATKKEFIEIVKKTDTYVLPSLDVELRKVGNLKFVDGEFKASDVWMRLLDTYGQQLRSKWYIIVCPQIEKLLKKHRVMMIHLSAIETFNFIEKIPENGLSCRISRKDLVPLIERPEEIRWLLDAKSQVRTIDGKDFAAVLVQTCWRKFWVRKRTFVGECKYIAASIIWVAWIVLKKKRQMHERYLRNMLESLDVTRQLSGKLSKDYSSIINSDHVVVHLPSVGFPLDIRRTLGTTDFGIYQNTMGLKLSFVKNPYAHVIYVLPVAPTEDLLTMYHELMESVSTGENIQKRVTFLELSQGTTFVDCSFNVSRTLHASEDTLVAIRSILVDKPSAFCLPWIMDECDVRVAGNFGVPLLGPDVELQRNMLDKSWMCKKINELGLNQPYHVAGIKDYATLCVKLAEQISVNTEICVWLLKLNVGLSSLHTGVFLINHMSIPFMPILRKERDIHGDEEWNKNVDTRSNFLKSLCEHLPGVVSNVTKLSKCYNSWQDFYAHVTKYGCLLQAVPNAKTSRYISVSLFVPGNVTGQMTQWTGTAEKIYSATESRRSTIAYIMPQTVVDNYELETIIGQLTVSLQREGYFGHLCVDLCCFRRRLDDKIVTLVVETRPCYEHVQQFVDWIELAIDGSYDRNSNSFVANVDTMSDIGVRRASTILSYERAKLDIDDNTGRYAFVIDNLYHSQMSSYSWKKLGALSKECGIQWNSSTKEGSHLILHDGTLKNLAMLIAIKPSILSAMILLKKCLKKLYKALRDEKRISGDNNLLEAIRRIDESLENQRNLTVDRCDPLNRVR